MPTRRVLLVLFSLCAEGTPVLALDLIREWRKTGIETRVATLSAEPSDMLKEFVAEEAAPICLSISKKRFTKFLDLVYQSYKLCRAVKPDVIVCFPFGWHGLIGWGGRLAGVKMTITHAGNYPPPAGDLRRKMAFTVRLGTILGSEVIACSEYVAAGIEEHFKIPKKSIHVIHNGIDLAAFDKKRARTTNQVRIGMVARLEMHKDQPTLIRAAKLLADAGQQVRVELVGEGSRREEYERLIASLGLTEHVKILGMRRDIPQILSTWDLFVFSAKPDEGLGIALIEALAAGVPVIASDVGACREVVLPSGQSLGTLVEAGSPEALSTAITKFIHHREPWIVRAEESKQKIQSRFSLKGMAGAYSEVMKLQEPRGRSN